MIRSLLAAGLCGALLTQNAAAQPMPTIELEVIGDGITVEIEIIRNPGPTPLSPQGH